jgi:hypothetical protein
MKKRSNLCQISIEIQQQQLVHKHNT